MVDGGSVGASACAAPPALRRLAVPVCGEMDGVELLELFEPEDDTGGADGCDSAAADVRDVVEALAAGFVAMVRDEAS